jgi:hypothetical protein
MKYLVACVLFDVQLILHSYEIFAIVEGIRYWVGIESYMYVILPSTINKCKKVSSMQGFLKYPKQRRDCCRYDANFDSLSGCLIYVINDCISQLHLQREEVKNYNWVTKHERRKNSLLSYEWDCVLLLSYHGTVILWWCAILLSWIIMYKNCCDIFWRRNESGLHVSRECRGLKQMESCWSNKML